MLLILGRAVCFYSANPIDFLVADEASAFGSII